LNIAILEKKKRIVWKEKKMTNKDKKRLQALMGKVFPRYREYPIYSMIPALDSDEDRVVVSMLITGDDMMLQDFKADTEGRADVETICYTEKNEHGVGKDLVIRIDFFYPTGNPTFKAVIYGDLLDLQKDFVKALSKVNELVVWVADKNRKVLNVMELDWDYIAHKPVLEQFL
jgi:hypothetical protein